MSNEKRNVGELNLYLYLIFKLPLSVNQDKYTETPITRMGISRPRTNMKSVKSNKSGLIKG